MIKKQTITLITIILILLIMAVNINEEVDKKKEIIHIELNETEEKKEPFRIENIGNVIYPKHPIVGWFIIGVVIALLVAVLDKVRIKQFFKRRK